MSLKLRLCILIVSRKLMKEKALRHFLSNPKTLYCFLHSTNNNIKEISYYNEVDSYWANTWGKKVSFNNNASWIKSL